MLLQNKNQNQRKIINFFEMNQNEDNDYYSLRVRTKLRGEDIQVHIRKKEMIIFCNLTVTKSRKRTIDKSQEREMIKIRAEKIQIQSVNETKP